MNSLETIQQIFVQHVKNIFPSLVLSDQQIRLKLNVDVSKQSLGDLTSSIAMNIAQMLKKNPCIVASEILTTFHHHPFIQKIDIAGPGFINMYLTKQGFKVLAQELFEYKESFFKPAVLEVRYNYSIEFVSANPTGPLHFGHGRGGIIGDVLGNILLFMGHQVTKEFYINDAGNQIQKLGESLKIRCMQAAGMDVAIAQDGYHGDYLIELGRDLFAHNGLSLFDKPMSFFTDYAKQKMLEQLQATLQSYGIEYDVWFSEKSLHESGSIERALKLLKNNELLFERDGALWFKTTQFGDDKDRVVRKATGEYTYIAADIAYLKNKIDRGFNNLVFVLGHDHHSYVTRLRAVKNGLGYELIPLDVILYQLVKIVDNGALVRMSKRAGSMVTLQDIIDVVGKDVARFFYLHRKADAQLEFDLALALKKTDENPVYYVQYAYVRTGSILEKIRQQDCFIDINVKDIEEIGLEEAFLLKKIMVLEQLLKDIAINHQTYLLTTYVIELAQLFHRYYSHIRIIDVADIQKSRARLAIIMIIRQTFSISFNLLGITCPERM